MRYIMVLLLVSPSLTAKSTISSFLYAITICLSSSQSYAPIFEPRISSSMQYNFLPEKCAFLKVPSPLKLLNFSNPSTLYSSIFSPVLTLRMLIFPLYEIPDIFFFKSIDSLRLPSSFQTARVPSPSAPITLLLPSCSTDSTPTTSALWTWASSPTICPFGEQKPSSPLLFPMTMQLALTCNRAVPFPLAPKLSTSNFPATQLTRATTITQIMKIMKDQ